MVYFGWTKAGSNGSISRALVSQRIPKMGRAEHSRFLGPQPSPPHCKAGVAKPYNLPQNEMFHLTQAAGAESCTVDSFT